MLIGEESPWLGDGGGFENNTLARDASFTVFTYTKMRRMRVKLDDARDAGDI